MHTRLRSFSKSISATAQLPIDFDAIFGCDVFAFFLQARESLDSF